MKATQEQVQAAIGRIDKVLSQVALARQEHVQLAQDLRIIQERVQESFMQTIAIEEQTKMIERLKELNCTLNALLEGSEDERTNQRTDDD